MRQVRLYGLFEKQPDGKWARIMPTLGYPEPQATRGRLF